MMYTLKQMVHMMMEPFEWFRYMIYVIFAIFVAVLLGTLIWHNIVHNQTK